MQKCLFFGLAEDIRGEFLEDWNGSFHAVMLKQE
jgi:hypothetical protein